MPIRNADDSDGSGNDMENRNEKYNLNVTAERGENEINAPGMVTSMSSKCAVEFAEKVLDGARDAFGQQAIKHLDTNSIDGSVRGAFQSDTG